MDITNESKAVLYEMYNYYSMQRKCGKPKREAIQFGSAKDIKGTLFPDLIFEDLEDSLRELGSNGLLKNFYADDTVYQCALTDSAIVTIENLPKSALLTLAKFVVSFIP